VENNFYRLDLDTRTGAIKSLLDKEFNCEMVDASAPYMLNQYLYVAGGEKTNIVDRGAGAPADLTISSPTSCRWRLLSDGPVASALEVEAATDLQHRIKTIIEVFKNEKKIRISNHLSKPITLKKEAAYFAFPFAADAPDLQIQIPDGLVRPNSDQLPGACKDWYCVRDGILLTSGNLVATWVSLDAPLVTLGDINRGQWQTELPLRNNWVFSYIINNYWFTNYKAGQEIAQAFQYVITSGGKADVVAATRRAWASAFPLETARIEKSSANTHLPAEGSLCNTIEDNVFLTTVKPAQDGKGFIVRLLEVAGKKTKAHLHLGLLKAVKAQRCSLVEEPLEELEIHDGAIAVDMPGHGIATVRVE
jgi:hypothetical protein